MMAVTLAETVATLRRQAEERRVRDTARATDVVRCVLDIVRSRLPAGGRVWLIGSLAWGGFGIRSDVDLVFDGTADSSITEIEMDLSRVAKIEVDVLRLSDLSAAFRDRVLREGIALHGG